MMGHNICFKGVIWKIIPGLSFLPLLIWSTVNCHCVCVLFHLRGNLSSMMCVVLSLFFKKQENTCKIDGWMTCDFTSFSTVFQSY